MKKLLLLLIFSSAFVSAQITYTNRAEFFKTARLGTAINARAYTATTLDTTQSFSTGNYASAYISVHSLDSASCLIRLQTSTNNTDWSLVTTLDSLSTGSNTGDFKTLNLTANIGAEPYARILFTFQNFRVGTTSATYSAFLNLRKF